MIFEIFIQEFEGGPWIKLGEIKASSITQARMILNGSIIKEKDEL